MTNLIFGVDKNGGPTKSPLLNDGQVAQMAAAPGVAGPVTVDSDSTTLRGPGGVVTPVQGGGIPSAFTTRALTSADNGATLVAAGAAVATVNTGFAAGYGCAFVGAGAVTFAGTATVTDYRTTGAANPSCALVNIGTDAYGVYGSKA